MGSSKIDKKVLTLDGDTLSVFGVEGYVLDEKSWCMNLLNGVMVQVRPAPASPEIEAIITEDFAGGKGDKIDHVRVNANIAVRLFLEGKIGRDHVTAATVGDNEITFHDVAFKAEGGSKPFKVVVMVDALMATIDKDGNIV